MINKIPAWRNNFAVASNWYRACDIPRMAKPGDKLIRPKFGFLHAGLFMPANAVFHNAPTTGEALASLEQFAAGELVCVIPQPHQVREAAVYRAHQLLLHPQPYNLITNNCDDSVSKALTGSSGSTQRQIVVALGLAGILLSLTKNGRALSR